jgi:hypothetical protein
MVNGTDAKRAHNVLGTRPREDTPSIGILRLGIVLLVGALLVAIGAMVAAIAGR